MSPIRGTARPRLVAVALLVGTFAAGLLSDAAVSALAQPPRPAPEVASTGVSHLDDLALSEGQRGTIDAILAGQQPRVDSIVQAALRDLQTVVDSLDVEVRAVLSPEQAVAYDRLRETAPGIRAVTRTTIGGDTIRVDTLGVAVP